MGGDYIEVCFKLLAKHVGRLSFKNIISDDSNQDLMASRVHNELLLKLSNK